MGFGSKTYATVSTIFGQVHVQGNHGKYSLLPTFNHNRGRDLRFSDTRFVCYLSDFLSPLIIDGGAMCVSISCNMDFFIVGWFLVCGDHNSILFKFRRRNKTQSLQHRPWEFQFLPKNLKYFVKIPWTRHEERLNGSLHKADSTEENSQREFPEPRVTDERNSHIVKSNGEKVLLYYEVEWWRNIKVALWSMSNAFQHRDTVQEQCLQNLGRKQDYLVQVKATEQGHLLVTLHENFL